MKTKKGVKKSTKKTKSSSKTSKKTVEKSDSKYTKRTKVKAEREPVVKTAAFTHNNRGVRPNSEAIKKHILGHDEPKGFFTKVTGQGKNKAKKSIFAGLKDSIMADIQPGSTVKPEMITPKKAPVTKGKIDMAFLKATIQDTLKQGDSRKHVKNVFDRVPTGIEGFDTAIEGGFIRDSVVLVCGGPGSGKSIFGMQYLINGIDQYGENGVYISFEEDPESLMCDMKRFDWDVEEKVKNKQLALLYYSPEQVDRVIYVGGGAVREVIESMDAKRVVIDSISAFTLLYESENDQRRALFSLFKTLKKWNCTTMLISEQTLSQDKHISTVEEYQSEGVVFLYHYKKGDLRERSIEIFKMRGTNHSTKIFPLKISSDGVTVYPDENVY